MGRARTIIAFHGTNQDFDRFEARFLGSANPNAASRQAVFFSRGRDAASDYARHAARSMIPDQEAHEAKVADLLSRADRAMDLGQYALYEQIILELEDLEGAACAAEPAGAVVLECELSIENPLVVSGQDREVIRDLGALLARARAAGHDAVVIRQICDTPRGHLLEDDHIAVFDCAKIEIVARHEPEPEPQEYAGPELDF